eukprot:m.92095 g.92095  ORF g.92095 m.92095 type:complete len:104 (+) comp9944_c1_seq2:133-444(+)
MSYGGLVPDALGRCLWSSSGAMRGTGAMVVAALPYIVDNAGHIRFSSVDNFVETLQRDVGTVMREPTITVYASAVAAVVVAGMIIFGIVRAALRPSVRTYKEE